MCRGAAVTGVTGRVADIRIHSACFGMRSCLLMKSLRALSVFVWFCVAALACNAQTTETHARRSPAAVQSSYWALVGQFVDKTAHVAYAQRMKEQHERDFTEKQQEEYSFVVTQYSGYLNRLRKNELVNRRQFWADAKTYAERMIIGPGVPIPGRPSAMYSLHTGSPAEDRELLVRVTGQIDIARATIADQDLLARQRGKTGASRPN